MYIHVVHVDMLLCMYVVVVHVHALTDSPARVADAGGVAVVEAAADLYLVVLSPPPPSPPVTGLESAARGWFPTRAPRLQRAPRRMQAARC